MIATRITMMNKIIAYILFVCFISCTASPSYEFLISSDRNGQSDIFLMNEKADILKEITSDTTEEWAPVWVDDQQISFLRQVGSRVEVILKDLESGKESKISQPPNCVLEDKNFTFLHSLEKRIYACNGNAYYVNAQNRNVTNLTKNLTSNINYLSWGQSWNELVFTSNHTGNNEVYIYYIGSNSLENISNNASNDERGDLSPDGKWMVYSSNRFNSNNQDIVVQNLETQEVERITESPGNELIARWSKDQKMIFFGSDKDGNWEIYSYQLESKETKRLTKNEFFDGDPRLR